MQHRNRIVSLFGIACLAVCAMLSSGNAGGQQDQRDPTVGSLARIENLMLPGSELIARPLVDEMSPIVLRIENAFPHGTAGFRYDLAYFGTVPGKHDLRDYLQRADGSSSDDLPPIEVEVLSLLPPGQVEPHPLSFGWFRRLGGYQFLALLSVILWVWGLAALLLLGRRKQAAAKVDAPPPTLAELLRPRLQAALEGRLNPDQYAELERMLLAYWRRRLGLEQLPPHEAIQRIREDELAGPVMCHLEAWMHGPQRDPEFDLTRLLRPLENLPGDEFTSAPPATDTQVGGQR